MFSTFLNQKIFAMGNLFKRKGTPQKKHRAESGTSDKPKRRGYDGTMAGPFRHINR